MQLFLLILINIIMCTIFYLILRLKLEKHASNYREKRFKREMDQIICEFNETAERNISILENRIETLKKLLEKTGTINQVDFSVDNNVEADIKKDNIKRKDDSLSSKEILIKSSEKMTHEFSEIEPGNSRKISHFYFQIKEKFDVAYKKIKKSRPDENYEAVYSSGNFNPEKIINKTESANKIILEIKENEPKGNLKEKESRMSEIELQKMFKFSDDKYSLISELADQGYQTEIISKCSGIPIGEINLVLDLNSSL